MKGSQGSLYEDSPTGISIELGISTLRTVTKIVLGLAGLGLLANIFMMPDASTSTAQGASEPEAWVPSATSRTPAGYEQGLAERAKLAEAELAKERLSEAPLPSPQHTLRVEGCISSNNCAFHLVGVATSNPYLQLSVIASEAKNWEEADWQAAVKYTQEKARWARANPTAAVQDFDGMPINAPYFPTAVYNVSKRLDRVSVGTATGRRTKEPRKGVPGWDAHNDPSRNNLPF